MAKFVPRLTRPEAGNKYYITKANGGYSNAIQGKPTDSLCDVLSNCVGYAYGRFNEIGGYGYCKYLSPSNAENFIQNCGGLAVGQTPKLGACMVWRKGNTLSGSDGAGHVAIVEKIISDTQIVTSESGWNSSPFWTKTRYKGSGNWGAGSGYVFLGFIYNPAVSDDAVVSGSTVTPGTSVGTTPDFNTTVPDEPLKFDVGDIVEYTGNIHFTNARATSGPSCRPGKVKITSRFPNGFHQYHVVAVAGGGSSAHGWVDADKLKAYDTSKEEDTIIGSSSTGSTADEKSIWNFLIGKGLNHFAAAGIMGNLFAESGLRSNNVQNSYEKKLGYTDASYTAAVDNGTYSNFVNDAAGYGICQWTYWSRKKALFDFAKEAKKSIGDLQMQLDFLWKELQDYGSVMAVLKSATTVKEASDIFMAKFENPADQTAAAKAKRASFGQKYFDKYYSAEPPEVPKDDSVAPDYEVGDIVNFTGTTHYVNAYAKTGPSCRPGKAKITSTYPKGTHPYHLVAVPGGGSTVYGWVDADCIARL